MVGVEEPDPGLEIGWDITDLLAGGNESLRERSAGGRHAR